MLVRAQQNDTLDLLCWRHLGTTAGVVEAALELNRNHGSEAILTHGQLIKLPELALQTAPTTDMIHLWD